MVTRLNAPPLYPFLLTEEGRRCPAFSYLTDSTESVSIQIPEFQDFALIRKRKPGARVLAVHPDLATQGSQRILLAQQSFGNGKVAVLATDPLWRWKLQSNSADSSYNEFWKGFIASLGGGKIHAGYWDIPSKSITPETPTKCFLNLSSRSKLSRLMIRAELTDLETNESVPLSLSSNDRPMRHSATFTPSAGHTYRLRAFSGNKLITESFLSCPSADGHKELQELSPNVDVLRRLAASSVRHKLLQSDLSFGWDAWLPDQPNENNQVKTETHLWHKPWIFLLMLSLFLGELIIRRRYKLV